MNIFEHGFFFLERTKLVPASTTNLFFSFNLDQLMKSYFNKAIG